MVFETKKQSKEKARKKAVRRAILLIKRINEKPPTELYQKVALNLLAERIPDDIKLEAITAVNSAYEHGIPTRTGRREDLRKEGKLDDSSIVIKVSIAGSGFGKWRTHVSKTLSGEDLGWGDDLGDKSEVTYYQREHDGSELMFAGPGGEGTKNPIQNEGQYDSGSNSIDELVKQVPPLVQKAIEEERARLSPNLPADQRKYDHMDKILSDDGPSKQRPILILIRGHSRGAVAAEHVAAKLKEEHPDARVELASFDPVPGPGHELTHGGKDVKIDLEPSALDEFTLVYSIASGHTAGFTPQTVMGANRIIITSQPHSAGMDEGFVFEGKRYKGSGMNSLQPGVYIDLNKAFESKIPLQRVSDIDAAKKKMKEAFEVSEKTGGNKYRKDVIKEVLEAYFNKG